MQIVRQISYKIVRFSDKSTKFGTDVEDHFTSKFRYWANAYHAPFNGFRLFTVPTNNSIFNDTINKENDEMNLKSL